MYLPIDGPNSYTGLIVGTTAQEIKVGASALDERKVVIIQSLGNFLYVGFDNAVTTSSGLRLRKNQTLIVECSDRAPLWVISNKAAGIDVRIWEMG